MRATSRHAGSLTDRRILHVITDLNDGGYPCLYVLARQDDRSQLTRARVAQVLAVWKEHVKQVHFVRQGLPPHFDDPFALRDPGQVAAPPSRPAEALIDLLVRVFPFVLVMWSLAGALYPAVDLCAGEKERGTMETLLISPVSREEIVYGKFLAIWVFSAATALLRRDDAIPVGHAVVNLVDLAGGPVDRCVTQADGQYALTVPASNTYQLTGVIATPGAQNVYSFVAQEAGPATITVDAPASTLQSSLSVSDPNSTTRTSGRRRLSSASAINPTGTARRGVAWRA